MLPITFSDLPTLNAFLNGIAACFLLSGRIAIYYGQVRLHMRFMLSAFATSVLFLISYLIYHFNGVITSYSGEGLARGVYFTILISHVILATAVVPLAVMTLWYAWKQQFSTHKKVARITWPIWMYVSVTGVIIYVMLYL